MKAFVQIADNGHYYSHNAHLAVEGLDLRGYDVIEVKWEDYDWLEWCTIHTPVIGSIGMVERALNHLNIEIPNVEFFPEVYSFYRRKIWKGVLGDALQGDNWPVFVKPSEHHKIFTGCLIGESGEGLYNIGGIDTTLPVFLSEPVIFKSEWRLYVLNKKVLYAGCYKGNFRLSIDWDLVPIIIDKLENPPIAFSLDMGVLDNDLTAIVEFNDAYSLGSYGIPSWMYVKMILSRWNEMVGLDTNI